MSNLSTRATPPENSYHFVLHYLKEEKSPAVNVLNRLSLNFTASQLTIRNTQLFERPIICASKTFLERSSQPILQMPGFLTYLKACQSLLTCNTLPQANHLDAIVKTFNQSALAGFAPAQFLMSYFYSIGIHSKNPMDTVKLCVSAAEQNFPPAQLYLGYRFRKGDRGFPQDVAKAEIWFTKAIQSGLTPSHIELCYFTGKTIYGNPYIQNPTPLPLPQNILPKAPPKAAPKAAPKAIIQKFVINNPAPAREDLSNQLTEAKMQIALLNEKIRGMEAAHSDQIMILNGRIHVLEETLNNRRADDQILRWVYEGAHSLPIGPVVIEPQIEELQPAPEPDSNEAPKETSAPQKRHDRPEARTSKRQRIPSRKKSET